MFLSYYCQPNAPKRDFSLKQRTANTIQSLTTFEVSVEILLSYKQHDFSPDVSVLY